MWSLLVARISRQISYDPLARRVISSSPGPAAFNRGGPPSLSETVAARAVAARRDPPPAPAQVERRGGPGGRWGGLGQGENQRPPRDGPHGHPGPAPARR